MTSGGQPLLFYFVTISKSGSAHLYVDIFKFSYIKNLTEIITGVGPSILVVLGNFARPGNKENIVDRDSSLV